MLSHRKGPLFIVLCATVTGAFVTLGGAGAMQFGVLAPEAVRPLIGPLMVLGVVALFTSMALLNEYAQVLHGAEFNLQSEESLNYREFMEFLRWCPSTLALTSLGLALVTFLYSLLGGSPSWSSNQTLALPTARGFLLFMAPFFLLPLPILVSGFRVPGSFTEQLAAKRSVARDT